MKRAILALVKPSVQQDMRTMLGLLDYQALAVTDNGMDALRFMHRYEPDLLIMGWHLTGLSSSELLQTLFEQHLCPTLVVLDADQSSLLQEVVRQDAQQVVFYPMRALDLGAAILLAEQRFKRERENADQIRRLEEEIKTRKLIYQAVIRLIEVRGWNEETAYSTLRSEAMVQRKSLRALAQDVLRGSWLPD